MNYKRILLSLLLLMLVSSPVLAQQGQQGYSPSLGVLRGQQIEKGLSDAERQGYEDALRYQQQAPSFSKPEPPRSRTNPYNRPYMNPYSDYYGLPQGEVDRIIQEQLQEGVK